MRPGWQSRMRLCQERPHVAVPTLRVRPQAIRRFRGRTRPQPRYCNQYHALKLSADTSSLPLFAQFARWGYEHVEPPLAAESPERGNPPKLKQVALIPRAHATGLSRAAVIATVGTVVVLTLDSALRAFSIGGARGTAREVAVILVNLLAAATAFWIAQVWQRSASGLPPGRQLGVLQRDLLPLFIACVCFFLPYLVLAVEAFVAWRRIWLGHADLVPDPQAAELAEEAHRDAVTAWKERVKRFADDEARRVETACQWYPVPFSPTVRMTCVFGGGADSWTAALATLGASLLRGRARIAIGDLSQRLTTYELSDLCEGTGIPASATVFADPPPTSATTSADPPPTSATAFADPPPTSADGLQRSTGGNRGRLEIVGVDKHADDAEYERCARRLFQSLLRRVRQSEINADVLVILGADRVGYDDLKSLLTAAERERIRVLLFFEQLRQHAVEIAGAGGAAAAFFALGNHLEAQEASRFIGTKQAWVLARTATTTGKSHTQTPGWTESTVVSVGGGLPLGVSFGMSTTSGRSYSESSGHSEERTEGQELTSEAVVTPEELRALRGTEMIYVELLPDGPAAVKVNCDPRIVDEPGVSSEPRRPSLYV